MYSSRQTKNICPKNDRSTGEDAMRGLRLLCYSFAILGLLLSARPGLAEDTITLQYISARKNAAGGVLGKKYELVPFDDKLQPAEALIALKSMTDQNIPFVMHCTGSNVGSALIDAVSKHKA